MYYNYSTEKRLMTNSLYEDEGRDWKEDFQHDNGQYFNTCRGCRHTFIGHKRRMICKKCATTPATEQHAFENPMPDLSGLKPGEPVPISSIPGLREHLAEGLEKGIFSIQGSLGTASAATATKCERGQIPLVSPECPLEDVSVTPNEYEPSLESAFVRCTQCGRQGSVTREATPPKEEV